MKPVGIERNSFQEWDSWHGGAGWGRRHFGHVGREGPLHVPCNFYLNCTFIKSRNHDDMNIETINIILIL